VLLDVDNGPAAFTTPSNADLSAIAGSPPFELRSSPAASLPSVSSREDRRFEQRLRYAGFDVTVERVRAASEKKGGPRHTIFVGTASTRAISRTGRPPIVGCEA
jgi:hypothetical protein